MQAVKQQSILSCKNVYLNNENIFLFKLMNRGVVDKIIAAQRCPHPDPPSQLPLNPILLGFPSAPGPSTCLMHPTWAGDLFHSR